MKRVYNRIGKDINIVYTLENLDITNIENNKWTNSVLYLALFRSQSLSPNPYFMGNTAWSYKLHTMAVKAVSAIKLKK